MGPLHLVEDKKNISIMSGKASLITINKSLFLMVGKKEKVKKEKSDQEVKAFQLAKIYVKMRGKYHKSKPGKPIKSKKDGDYKHFLKAVNIIERIDCSYKEFIQAQVKGLEFTNEGRGIFPEPHQFSTDRAEGRILSFLSEHRTKDDKDYIKDTPLTENEDYVDAWFDFLAGKATLKQMKYIRKAQKIRDGVVQKKVRIEIKRLKDKKE